MLSTAKPSYPAKILTPGRSLSSRDPRRKSADARQPSEVTDSSSTEPNSSKKMPGGTSKSSGENHNVEDEIIPNIQATFLLIQNNKDHTLISEENLKDITFKNPQIITELGIRITKSNQNKLRFTETTIQSKQSHSPEGEFTSETTLKPKESK